MGRLIRFAQIGGHKHRRTFDLKWLHVAAYLALSVLVAFNGETGGDDRVSRMCLSLIGTGIMYVVFVMPLTWLAHDALCQWLKRPGPMTGVDWPHVMAIETEIYGKAIHNGLGEIILPGPPKTVEIGKDQVARGSCGHVLVAAEDHQCCTPCNVVWNGLRAAQNRWDHHFRDHVAITGIPPGYIREKISKRSGETISERLIPEPGSVEELRRSVYHLADQMRADMGLAADPHGHRFMADSGRCEPCRRHNIGLD